MHSVTIDHSSIVDVSRGVKAGGRPRYRDGSAQCLWRARELDVLLDLLTSQ
jgi:hypothetical protein